MIFNILLWFLVILLAVLITGLFKYQIIAVGSGSMEPNISYGDAIIFEKFKDDYKYYELKVGDIIVFRHNNDMIVHRILSITYTSDDISVETKGDHNENKDSYVLHKKDILGKFDIKIKYIGTPTLWLRDIFNK